MAFKELPLGEVSLNLFTKLDKEWGLVAAGNADASNAMTVSWGGMGTIWNKPVVTIYIRPQRYTKQFVDANDHFTLSFFDSQYKQALSVLGTKSGRDGDKIAEVGFSPVQLDGTTTYEQADLVFVCRKLYADTIKPECFVDASVDEQNYPQRDHHTLYIRRSRARLPAHLIESLASLWRCGLRLASRSHMKQKIPFRRHLARSKWDFLLHLRCGLQCRPVTVAHHPFLPPPNPDGPRLQGGLSPWSRKPAKPDSGTRGRARRWDRTPVLLQCGAENP